MKHLYRNDDGEMVAADTLEQAWRHHDIELGGEKEKQGDWEQVPDAACIEYGDDEDGKKRHRRADAIAAEYAEPTLALTSYT